MPTTTQTLQTGRYSIEQELAVRGSCIHFRAYDTHSEDAVSIFEIIPQLPKVATLSQREGLEAAFTARTKTLSALKQKALPLVRGSFIEGGRYYVVTDCVAGTDLLSTSKDLDRAFPAIQLADWADGLLEALTALHSCRPPLVYRNLNPENVILGQQGSVTLSILGLFDPNEPAPSASRNGTTSGSAIAFSPLEQIWSGLDAASQKVIINQYDESSERILKQELDSRSDIYSLGATLYFLATGHIPIDALERSIEMIDGNPDPLLSPNNIDPEIPAEVSDVIMKAMEIRREYRFDSAAIMRQVLRTALIRIKEREGSELQRIPSRPAAARTGMEPGRNGQVNATDDVAQRLREAEQKRVEAERRAAEAEKKLREAEEAQARTTESFNLSQLDDDVLGLLSSTPPHSSDAPDAKPRETVSTPSETAPELGDDISSIFDKAALKASKEDLNIPKDLAEAGFLAEERQLVEAAGSGERPTPDLGESVSPLTASARERDHKSPFESKTAETDRSFRIGLPMIAIAAAIVCVVAIGSWLIFGRGTGTDAAATIEAQPSVQEKPSEPQVQNAYQPVETSQPPVAEPAAEISPAGDQQAIEPEKATPAKTKKAAPARTPIPKKAVTVDDLINDN